MNRRVIELRRQAVNLLRSEIKCWECQLRGFQADIDKRIHGHYQQIDELLNQIDKLIREEASGCQDEK